MSTDAILELTAELDEQLQDLESARARGRLRGESVAVTQATIRAQRMKAILEREASAN